jgi:protease-4
MPDHAPKKRENSSLFRKILTGFRSFFALIGFMVVISLVMFFFTFQKLTNIQAPPIAKTTVLTYTFDERLPEVVTSPNLSRPLLSTATTLHDVINALDTGSEDDRVKGFIARIKNNSIDIAQLQELRDAIFRFRASGKFAYVFSTSYGDFSNGLTDYYLASAFEEVWLQPIGNLSITGLSGQLPFFADTMDKLGINAELYTRADYKTAAEPLTRSTASPENRAMTKRLLGSIYNQVITDIATARQKEPDYIEALVDRSPLFDTQALDSGLVDRLGYLDEMVEYSKENLSDEAKDDAKLIELNLYAKRVASHKKSNEPSDRFSAAKDKLDKEDIKPSRIAVIYGSGAIMPDDGKRGRSAPMGTGPVLSAEDMVIALNTAREDPRVGAIIIRLNSPGGSATASESIAHAVRKAQEDGKPVLVSMSTAAASGGYWLAAGADQIVAQPTTLTGSIGVLAGKVVIGDMLDKIGVNIEEFNFGENAGMWSSIENFSPKEKQQVNAMLDNIYDAFLTRVSEGRKIPYDTLKNELAGGRVWTGSEALEIGLVDALGGLDKTIHLAQTMMDLPEGQDADIVQYPRPKTTLELFLDMATNGVALDDPFTAMMHKMGFTALPADHTTYVRLPTIR